MLNYSSFYSSIYFLAIVGGIIAPILGSTVIAYAGHSASKTHPSGDVDAIGAMMIYPVNKNFLLKVNYEHVETEKVFKDDTDTTRVYLSYKF